MESLSPLIHPSSLWDSLQIVANLVLGAACLAMAGTISWFVLRRRDVLHPPALWVFSALALTCGLVQLAEASTYWFPVDRPLGPLKLATALLAWVALLGLARVLPQAASLNRLNDELKRKIDERRRAEEAIETHRRQLLSIFDSIDEPVYVSDPNTHELLYVNEAFKAHWGAGTGDKCYRVLQGLDSPCSFCSNDRIFGDNAGAAYIQEFQNRKTGRWFRCVDKAIRWPDGRMVRCELAFDLTDRKLAEETLRKSEERFRKIAEGSFDIIYTADKEGHLTYVSPALERVLGYTPERTIGKHFKNFISESHLAKAAEAHDEVMRGGSIQGLQLEVLKQDGSSATVEINSSPIAKDGTVVESQGIIRDVTERRRVEEQLIRSEEKYRLHFESVSDVVFSIDREFRLVSVSPSVERILGYKPEELNGRPFGELNVLAPKCLKVAFSEVAQILAGVSISSSVYEFIAKDGTRKFCEISGAPLTRDGGVAAAVCVARDVTERKHAMTELAEAKQAAETANRAKSEFLANMSHEIRTPMTAILGFADVLLGDLAEPENVDAVHTIKRNGEHLLGIINDILDLSKIEAGKLQIERKPCSPVKIVAEVASLMRVRAAAKNLLLEVDYAGPIPESIRSDPTRLRQILINLVGNAVKFTEAGSVRLVTRLLDEAGKPPKLRVDVIDTGIGMTEELVGRIFQPFTQGHTSTTREFSGTGLGLTISKRLAEMLGGEVTVSSSPGRGSTFSVTVETGPLDGVSMLEGPAEAALPSDRQPHPSSDPQLKLHCRVLLAEDGLDNQRLISFLLRKAGADVTVAENGRIACEKALASLAGRGRRCDDPKSAFDVILMDMQMPEMDGYEATRRLREAGYTGPIVALTAHAMTHDRQKCVDAGCDDYLTKPIDRLRLLKTVAGFADQTSNCTGTRR